MERHELLEQAVAEVASTLAPAFIEHIQKLWWTWQPIKGRRADGDVSRCHVGGAAARAGRRACWQALKTRVLGECHNQRNPIFPEMKRP